MCLSSMGLGYPIALDDLWRMLGSCDPCVAEGTRSGCRRVAVILIFALCKIHLALSLAGISTYDVSLEKQEVFVKGTILYNDLLEKIKKTGKEVGVFVMGFYLIFIANRQVRSGETLE